MTRLNGLSLFSGIGGLDLAFEWAGGHVAAMCEIDTYCQRVLRKHWPDIPLFNDVREVKCSNVGAVDIIYGGFPCQPFSVAGKQKGKGDTRYLWPEFSRLVAEIRPRWVVAENVPGIIRIAADDVCTELERQGYKVGIWDFEAASVGAKHRRERIFFVAHAGRSLRQGSFERGALRNEGTRGNACQLERPSSPSSTNATSRQREAQRGAGSVQETNITTRRNSRWKPEPKLGGMADGIFTGLDERELTFWNINPEPVNRTAKGIPNRTKRLKALGNAVVPQQAYPIFKAIADMESMGLDLEGR